MKKRLVLILLALAAVVILAVVAGRGHGDIVVYYTNDIHSYIDNHLDEEPGLSYSKVAALKNTTENALLVDAGDHLQGTAYGGMDNGTTIIQLMNATMTQLLWEITSLTMAWQAVWQPSMLRSIPMCPAISAMSRTVYREIWC